ncbi:unnamed protein product [Notodromas monacha]|uniref:Uncharacterized protein n=1 Tax=Notodromas monacha TaxID=399045 RepID=A0A7R9BNN2_9CRUS|nr:unnamed protein product [Notodromas monacha]CAG0918854.1 unnamed protein product [Notodromas monacha]
MDAKFIGKDSQKGEQDQSSETHDAKTCTDQKHDHHEEASTHQQQAHKHTEQKDEEHHGKHDD